jgi:hypothetical protein
MFVVQAKVLQFAYPDTETRMILYQGKVHTTELLRYLI